MPKIFARLRFFYAAFVISSVVSLMIVLLKLFPKKKAQILHQWNRVMIKLLGARVKTVGEPDPEAQLFLMNHQGIVDIIAMESVMTRNLRWVAKKELFEVPWFGLLLKNGEMISIDREDRRGLIKLLKDAKESLEILHRPIAIFPEGTRSKTQKLLPFKEGARIVAEKFKLKVQPVVILGSKRIVNEHEKLSGSGEVTLIFLPTIDLSKPHEGWYEALHETMQARIDRERSDHARIR
jgi:1-acyl-sn-glycerol-3-phosphate acyltransferase